MLAKVELELLPHEEYELLVGVIEQAERQSIKARQQPAEATAQPEAPHDPQAAAGSTAKDTCDNQALVDLEDVGLVLDRRRFRRRGFYVTDFSQAEWCQQQAAFSMSARLPREVTTTAEMSAGLAAHAKLEAETSAIIEVAVETPEDAWALKLLNTIQGIHQLLSKGLTRELGVFGYFMGIYVRGVIDQLELTEDGNILLVEYKTRRHRSLPSEAQRRGTGLQVMMYCFLLEHLESLLECSENHDKFVLERGLSNTQLLSSTVQQHALNNMAVRVTDLPSVVEQLSYAVAALPLCHIAEVRYMWQQDHSHIGKELVVYNRDTLLKHAELHVLFWQGRLAPQKVRDTDVWKCHNCLFNTHCYDPANRANSLPAQQDGFVA